jgi:exodeoxyribonuclease VII large subunit
LSILTVSRVTTYIKDSLETDDLLGDLWVAGEVSNFTRAQSGHLYFSVKDAGASLKCVMWRSAATKRPYQPRDGDAVVLHGRITVYEPRGEYQLQVDLIQPEGVGLLYQAFLELKERLEAEGLFDAGRKRSLPRFPRRIGVVTSPTAAVLRDIVNVLTRRYPLAQVVLAPAAVQGLDAPPQIVSALTALNALGNIDVIIIARGGGSLEDMWAFNDEQVARAIVASAVPVVSAVGHETDFTIADFVADLRAPTPSAAAELVAPDVRDLSQQLLAHESSLGDAMQRILSDLGSRVEERSRLLRRFSPDQVIARQRQRLDELARAAAAAVAHRLLLERERTGALSARLATLSPYATLGRGYAIVRHAGGGLVVTQVAQVTAGDPLDVRVADGAFPAIAGDIIGRGRSPQSGG